MRLDNRHDTIEEDEKAFMYALTDYDDVMTISQLTQALQISRITADKLIKTGKIYAVKIGCQYRITKYSVMCFLGLIKEVPEDND